MKGFDTSVLATDEELSNAVRLPRMVEQAERVLVFGQEGDGDALALMVKSYAEREELEKKRAYADLQRERERIAYRKTILMALYLMVMVFLCVVGPALGWWQPRGCR